MMMRMGFLLACVGMLLFSGCSLSVDVKTPTPTGQKLTQSVEKKTILSMRDSRVGEDKNLSMGKINYTLINMENELQFLGENIEKELQSRGINLQYQSAPGDLLLNVKKYQIVNLRTSGFHPMWTYTMFSGDISIGGQSKTIAFYWLADKTPIWSMDEVNDPCFNIPVSLMVKEVAAKLNRHYFQKRSSNATVNQIASEIDRMQKAVAGKGGDDTSAEATRNAIPLKVLELGYTNNKTALKPLLELLDDEDVFIRVAATAAIGILGEESQFNRLKTLYETKDDIEKAMALKSIGDLGTAEAFSYMKKVKASSVYQDQMFQLLVDLYI